MRKGTGWFAVCVALTVFASVAHAKDLGEILLKKGLITPEELKQAQEDEKQESAAEDSRRDAIMAKLPKWLDAITLFGDLRTRYENFAQADTIARNRDRLRGRIGLVANVSDEVSATFRLATGDPNNPVTRNQTFQNVFTQKPINLDQAYLTLKPGKSFNLEPGWITVTGGKFSANAYRVSELVWDDDLTPEGATETLNLVERREGFLRGLRLNGFQWVVDEIGAQEDPWMGGAQAVTETGLGTAATWNFAFANYHYENLNQVAAKFLSSFAAPTKASAPNFSANSSLNTQLGNTNSIQFSAPDANGNKRVLRYAEGFNIVDAATELNVASVLGIPAGVFGEFAYNTQADTKNVGFYVGAGIGNAGRDWYHNALKNKGDWGVSYTYAYVERDAVLALFTYDDVVYTQKQASQPVGGTNIGAHIVRLDYELLPNLQLTAKTHLINALDDHVAPSTALFSYKGNATLVRTQLDAVLKF